MKVPSGPGEGVGAGRVAVCGVERLGAGAVCVWPVTNKCLLGLCGSVDLSMYLCRAHECAEPINVQSRVS